MKIQFVTHWTKRHCWGPIPNEWFLLEGFIQAGLGRIQGKFNPPQHQILPLTLLGNGSHEIHLNSFPLKGYDLSLIMSSPDYIPFLNSIDGYKAGITFDLPSFTPERYKWFLKWSAPLNLVFETGLTPLDCPTVLVRQGVRKGSPFLKRKEKLPLAFFGRVDRRGKWAAFLESMGCEFFGTVPKGVFDGELWKLLSKISIVFGAPGWPYYWSNRVYKMIEVGACFVTPYKAGLENDFENDKHIVWRESNEGLEEIVKELLLQKEKQEAIRYEAWKIGQEKYTYYHRAKEIMVVLREEGLPC